MRVNYQLIVATVTLICHSLPIAHFWPNHDISTLKLLQVVHRHGDRNAENWFPKDPYNNLTKYWYEGEGQLTNQGKYRMYKVGQFIRDHYKTYLGEEFSPREVYARSSAKPRCLESAQMVLSGAYPNNNTIWQWSRGNDSVLGLYWQPFPIESFIPMDDDRLLRVEAPCPAAEDREQQVYHSAQVQSFIDSHKPFLDEVTAKMGRKFRDIEDMNDFWDTISIEMNRGYKWSNFSVWNRTFETQVLDTMTQIARFYWDIKFNDTLIKRVRGGPLVQELDKNFRSKIDGGIGEKVMFYSTHDSKINALMKLLDVYNNIIMPFGTTLFFELHQNPNNSSYFTRIYLYNETLTDKSPNLLKLPGCDLLDDCPIDKFVSLSKQLSVQNWDNECGIADPTKSSFTTVNIVLLVLNVILAVILITVLSMIWYRRRRDLYQSLE